MGLSPPPQSLGEDEGGYASLTAIILCAALSILCAGLVALAMSQKAAARRELYRAQAVEAMNTAMMRTAAAILTQTGAATVNNTEAVVTPQGVMTVQVRAEQEARKWPLDKLDTVDEAILAHYTHLSKAELAEPANADCLRSLFSAYGYTPPDRILPPTTGLIASGGHDGEVWRLRAILGGRLEERQVRFLGDPHHLFAVVSQQDLALGEMPTCPSLTVQP